MAQLKEVFSALNVQLFNSGSGSTMLKVVKLLWDQSLFPSLTIPAILNNLRLWIFGISSPLNPSMNKLHKLCTEYSD